LSKSTWRLLSALFVALIPSVLYQPPARGQSAAMELVSVNTSGTASGLSGLSAPVPFSTGDPKLRSHISGTGRYVVFESSAFQLACTDANTVADVFVRDRQTGVNTIVSLTAAGLASNNHSFDSGITPNGRYVVFGSQATNLVPGDTNGFLDIFVRDREAGTTERVSVSSAGAQGDMHSFHPTISADGRYVSFVSFASNLVSGDTNNREDVFVHDRLTLTTERVSVTGTGDQAAGGSHSADISADGRLVAFTSTAGNLFPGVTGFFTGIFVRDRLLGTTTLASVTPFGALPNLGSREPAISADGRFVAYSSNATDIVVPDAGNGLFSSVFLHDRQTGTTERIGVSSSGVQGDRDHRKPSVSADGRIVVFTSWSTNLVAGDTNDNWDLFRRDRVLGTTERISLLTQDGSVTADGNTIYLQTATQLAPADTNTVVDIYLLAPPVTPATPGISFSAAHYDVAEENGTATITVTRTGNVCAAASVEYSLTDGSASGGEDYVQEGGTVGFAAGETAKTFSAFVTDDLSDEPDETVHLALSNATGAALGTPAAATLTILDNDEPPANTLPVAVDDAATTSEDTPVAIAALLNDSDADGDPLAIAGFGQGAHGTVTQNGGTLTYTPLSNFHGADTFGYLIGDGRGGTAAASIRVTVAAVNDPPVAAADSYTTPQGAPLTVPATGVLANDSDIDGDALAAVLITGPAQGSVTLAANGSFSYSPPAAFAGSVTFTYRAVDPGQAESNAATVTVVVEPTQLRLSIGRPVIPARLHRMSSIPRPFIGEPFVTNRRLALIENDTVPCVEVDTMEVARCEFLVAAAFDGPRRLAVASGDWLEDRDGRRYAIVGQPVTRDGSWSAGAFIVGTVPDADGRVPTIGATGRDSAGTVAGTNLAQTCVLEIPRSETNVSGQLLRNHATRYIGTTTLVHPDQALLVSVDPEKGVAWYTGRGAALNDMGGVERGPKGIYYDDTDAFGEGKAYACHYIDVGSVQVPAGKRPSTKSYPAPGVVNVNSPIRWLPANPYVDIANDSPFDPRVGPAPRASFTWGFGVNTLFLDAGASQGDLLFYLWDVRWFVRPTLEPEFVWSVGTSPLAEFPFAFSGVPGPYSMVRVTLTVVSRDGQVHTREESFRLPRRNPFPTIPGAANPQ
jgi:Tol biopolymer transport system component